MTITNITSYIGWSIDPPWRPTASGAMAVWNELWHHGTWLEHVVRWTYRPDRDGD